MHVYEVPGTVFRNLAEETEEVNVRAFIKDKYSHVGFQESKEFPDQNILIGLVGKHALRLDTDDTESVLSLHNDRDSAVINSQFDAIACVRADRKHTGKWSYGKGSEYSEGLTFEILHNSFSHVLIEDALATLGAISILSEETRNVLNSIPVEVSRFYENETDISILE